MIRFGASILAGLLLAPVATHTAPTPAQSPSATSSDDLKLAEVPVELHRRAADALELGRERDGSSWADARLSPRVVPMFQPGAEAPTHYEVGVEGPGGEPRGFIVLSNGRHDYPIAFSTAEGPRRTDELADAVPVGERIARVHYFSPVSMVAESASGDMLATLGGFPVKVERAEMAWLDAPASARLGHTHYDAATDTLASEDPEHRIELGTWGSWGELRDDYAQNTAVLREALRRGAADDWDAEDDFAASGEGLQSGWFRELPVLARGSVSTRVTGPGARYVRVRTDERGYEGDSAVRVFVEAMPPGEVYPVEVTMTYADGSSEVHRFDVTASIEYGATPTGLLGALPHAAMAAPNATAAPECRKAVLKSHWSTYVFARNGGGSTVEAKGGWIGGWEVFTIHKAGRHNIELQASNGEWVYASGATVRADGLNGGGDAVFQRMTYSNGKVALRARNRRYLKADTEGRITADATRANTWEKFELEYCEPSRLEGHWAGGNPIDAYNKVRKYDQIPGKFDRNTSDCSTGCGATVWAMLFGWADHMASIGDRRWAGAANLYRKDGKNDGAPAVAPQWMWNDVPGRLRTVGATSNLIEGPATMVLELRNLMQDWGASGCAAGDNRFTVPHIMGQATKYLQGRVTANLTADYDGASVMTHEGKTKAKRRLEDKQVVAIGIGYYSHYPLAYGFEDARFAKWDDSTRRWARSSRHQRFIVHMGWGHPGSSNVPYDAWFQGWIDPPATATQTSNQANGSATAPKAPLPKANKPLNPTQKLPGGPLTPTFPR